MRRLALSFLFFLSVLGPTACATIDFDLDLDGDVVPPSIERQDIKSRDQDAIYPGVKVSWAIFPRNGEARKGILDPGALAEWPQVFRSDEKVRAKADDGPAAASIDASLDTPEGSNRQSASPIDATSEKSKPRARRRSRVRFILSLDLDYAVGVGVDDDKGLTAFDFIEFEGVQTFGPAQLEYNYDLHLGSVFVRSGIRLFDILSVEGLGGVSISALDLQVHSATARTTETIVGYGGNIGVRLTLTPHRVIDLYTQFQLHVLGSPQSDQQTITLSTFEAGGQLHLTSNFSAFTGWRSWRYVDRIRHASNVEVEDLSGPTFGLLIRY